MNELKSCFEHGNDYEDDEDDDSDVMEEKKSIYLMRRRHLQNHKANEEEENVIITIKHLQKSYKQTSRDLLNQLFNTTSSNEIHQVVKGITFKVEQGEIMGLLGPNGAGKTTTIKMIIGEESITHGSFEIHHDNQDDVLGYCPQFDAQWRNITIKEHLKMFATLKGITNGSDNQKYILNVSKIDQYNYVFADM